MAKPKDSRRAYRGTAERVAVDLIDEVREFQQFKADLLPILRKDVMNGAPAKDILDKVKSIAAARLGLIAASAIDQRTALNAISEILNRTDGKPKESVTTTHKFANLKTEELDALLISKYKDVKDINEDE